MRIIRTPCRIGVLNFRRVEDEVVVVVVDEFGLPYHVSPKKIKDDTPINTNAATIICSKPRRSFRSTNAKTTVMIGNVEATTGVWIESQGIAFLLHVSWVFYISS